MTDFESDPVGYVEVARKKRDARKQPIPATTNDRCPACLSDSRKYGNMRPCENPWHTEQPAAPNETLYCDVCGSELQRESCNHIRPCAKCAEKAEADLRECARDFGKYADHKNGCSMKDRPVTDCPCGYCEAAERWREVGK